LSQYAKGKGPTCLECHKNEVRTRGAATCAQCSRTPGWHLPKVAPAPQLVKADQDRIRHAGAIDSLKKRYAAALHTIAQQETALSALGALGDRIDTFKIEPKLPSKTAEGTVVLVGSDWHIEENVGAEVGGLNRYNLAIAKRRATQFFQSGLRLTTLLQKDIQIGTMVLALLGDFISNDIHEEFPEVNEQTPMHAIVTAQGFIASGIQFLLDNSKLDLLIPCHSGNHGRTTRTTRFGTENGHSLEFLMYSHLAAYFRHEPRVRFLIPEGMHSYVQVYDSLIRFQHGHAIKYGGGVGGIYIPVNKAISQWNKGRRADLDVFGHFHQMRDGGNFVCNGSLIGYSSFALSIKADYEPPKQALFLMDKKRGRTATWPVLFDDAAPVTARKAA
jgi:hypothetical protein